MYFAQKSVPDGWLICNGATLNRTQYANLFAAIGTTYGAGDGSTTFKIPNLNNLFIEGTTSTGSVGQSVAAGLPNITGTLNGDDENQVNITGAFSVIGSARNGEGSGNGVTIDFNASRSNGLYGAASTVQPPAIRLLPCIKA